MATAAAGSTSQMFRKIQATKAANATARIADEKRRASCPFEANRRYLQQRGYTVYAESVHRPSSKLFVVGTRLMTKGELNAFAAALKLRTPPQPRD